MIPSQYKTSLHNHTTWSDGLNSPREMLDAAQKAGYTQFGFSDHLVIHPQLQDINWSMNPDRIADYVAELTSLKPVAREMGIDLKVGVEVDFFPQNAEDIVEELKKYPLDYLIGSVHYFGTFPIDNNADDWAPLSQEEIDTIWRGYWDLEKQLCASGLYTMVGHLDLPKKFNFLPSFDYRPLAVEALQALAHTAMTMELNTAGWRKPCQDGYPSAALLQEANALGIPVTVSEDAHEIEHVGLLTQRGDDALRALGFQHSYYQL